MAQLSYIDQLPSITEQMIRMLPSYTGTEPISLEDFGKIPAPSGRNPKLKVSDIITKIQDNIKLLKGNVKIRLQESLDIQLAIIQHGYEGVCPNDYAANQIVKQIKLTYEQGRTTSKR